MLQTFYGKCLQLVYIPYKKGFFMSVENMIIGTFSQAFKKNFYNELVIGKLAHTEFKDGVKKGDEVDVIMPGTVTMFDYDGSTLNELLRLQR